MDNIETLDMTLSPLMIGNYQERLRREHQVKVLNEDINNPVWERAHLALFIVEEKPGTRWHNFLLRANAAYQRGDRERFKIILDDMGESVKRKRNGKTDE